MDVGAVWTGHDDIINVCKQEYEGAVGMVSDKDTSICIETPKPELFQGSVKLDPPDSGSLLQAVNGSE